MRRTELKRGKPPRPGQPLERGTPLARTAGPTRRTRLKTRRVSKRFATRRDPKYCAWIRTLGCCAAQPYSLSLYVRGATLKPCAGPVECAHVKSRGAGGDDRGNTLPLCRRHHRQQHDIGLVTFGHHYCLDFYGTAEVLEARYVLRDFGGLSGSAGERTHE